MNADWRVGVDIGGTFTDVLAVNVKTAEQRVAKVRSRKGNPLTSLIKGLKAVDLSWQEVSELVHGTTMVTNAIVEEKFNSVALVATQGFSDSIEIGRQNRLHLYRLDLLPKPAPQVAREMRFEVSERTDHNGRALKSLCGRSVKEVTSRLKKLKPDAVAISFLHAYANPAHERAMAAQLAGITDNIALSHQVNPEAREYERTSTTVLSASIMKPVSTYLEQIKRTMPKENALYFFHSAGGMTTPQVVRQLPLSLVFSGPAAGVAAAAEVTRQLRLDHAISFDMGGTTTDVCLISQGRAEISNQRALGGRPLRMPMVGVESIGAGGGSIARFDSGVLRVGPESAGADPGPACYGRGGTEPTVTDANLALGYLTPEHRLGDGTRLHPEAAQQALQALATKIGMSVYELASGILDVADANMLRALRRISVDRGVDGRQCALLAFGGAGPIHAVKLARAFDMSTVVVPGHSSIFSAFGCVAAEKSLSMQQTVRMKSSAWDGDAVNKQRNGIAERLAAAFQDTDHDKLVFDDVALVRYIGQSYSVEISAPDLANPQLLGQGFKAMHERLYGFVTGEDWELEALRITASIPAQKISSERKSGPPAAPGEYAQVSPCWFNGDKPVSTPRYAREKLPGGSRVRGPAIIEDNWSATVLPPGAQLEVDGYGHLIIEVGHAG